MESLCIRDALKLRRIVAPYLPPVSDEDTVLEVVHQVIDGMKERKPQDYLDSVLLMSGKSLEELKEMESLDILDLFVNGLTVNQILRLDSFCQQIGLRYG